MKEEAWVSRNGNIFLIELKPIPGFFFVSISGMDSTGQLFAESIYFFNAKSFRRAMKRDDLEKVCDL